MRDIISIQKVKELHPKIRDEVKTLIEKAEEGFPPTVAIRIVQGYRSIAYQNELYQKGRTTPGPNVRPGHPLGDIVTKARGGSSLHNYRLAFDFAIMYDLNGDGKFETLSWDVLKDFDRDGQKDWMEVVNVFKAAGYTWGGDFNSIPDAPHLQKTFGYTVSQLLAKYNAGKVDAEGNVLL